MNTLIFKTNINTEPDFLKVKSALKSKFDIKDTTIDLEDCDRVLRVITNNGTSLKISEEIKGLSYFCEELED